MAILSDTEDDEKLNAEYIDLNDIDETTGSSDSSDYTSSSDEDEREQENDGRKKTSPLARVYIPNISRLLPTDDPERLECDYSVYVLYHKTSTEFPCLSFDVLEDSLGSGDQRSLTFPMTTFIVTGTQADKDHRNNLIVMKCFNMLPNEKKDDDDGDDEDDENIPYINFISIPHAGCINRVRARKIGQKLVTATWSDHGAVHLWNITEAFQACDGDVRIVNEFNKKSLKTKPIYSFNGHHSSGYGLDWSPVDEGSLASGDSHKYIFIWKLADDGWKVDQLPLTGHQDSVEDIQWSPNEPTILSSCSVDRSIRVWDTRNKRHESAIIIPESHESDVNVISWNRIEKAFILSGGDDGAIKIWDLRQVRRNQKSSDGTNGSKPVAVFKHHRGPITSVHWHPTDSTVFAASSEDNQITQWDLGVENDEDQEEESQQKNKKQKLQEESQDESAVQQLAPQLLFIHQGQKEVKEIRWHPQIPGVLISTASTGFDIFRTISV